MRPTMLPTANFAADLVEADLRASEGTLTQANYDLLLRRMRDGEASVSAMRSLDAIARRASLDSRIAISVSMPTHRWDPATKTVSRL
jgi:hypothetical protein